jgi:site-specific DNA-methyltransferase (adenine-specific)/adenine-specific DNA-methyltransferase
MPTLDWIGKKAVVNHHQEVPFHLLRDVPELGCGPADSGNLIVEGDNLTSLKALLPYYAGQVKCIYIDPPYNTGNESWVYNDNTNSPEIKAWLGKVVGKEAEDLSRHDKWLCMMYPRLKLLREFLREDGAIFISLDDNEIQSLRFIMDEIFGRQNFVATVIWQKVFSTKNSARHFSESHDFIVAYAKQALTWTPNLVARGDEQDARYKNPDNDPRGPWTSGDCSARNFYSEGTYSIACPSGRLIDGPPAGMYWRFSKRKFEELNADGRIWWGKDRNNVPRLKRFLSEVKRGLVPETLWTHPEVGHTQEAKKELVSVMDFADSESVFITPKPTRLIERVLQIASGPGDLVMDSFAGSGTTGHAVLKLNAAQPDQPPRRFILAEIDPKIARPVTAERVKRIALGYTNAKGETVAGLGGGFRYVQLGEPLFDASGKIRPTVRFRDLARHVFFTETGTPLPHDAPCDKPLLGVAHGTGVYLLYNGILKDKSPDGGNVLTLPILTLLPPHEGPRVIYGTACRISPQRLKTLGIVFKQTPYAIKVR